MCNDCGGPRRKGPWEFPEPVTEKYPLWVRVVVIVGAVAFMWTAIIGLYLALT